MTWTFSDIDEFADFLLRAAGITEPPVDVEHLARHLGVDGIVSRRLDREEGRLQLRDSDALIVLNTDMSRARRRFTIAHEIGHLVLADPRFDLAPLCAKRSFRTEEHFCDRLAEALLMPASWIVDRYDQLPQCLSTMLDCTSRFGVSAAAAAVRLQRILRWSRSLLRFRLCRDEWTLLSVTAWQPEPRAEVSATEATRAVLERFAVPDSTSRLWLPLSVADREWHVGAELWGRSGWALALADSRRRRPSRRRDEISARAAPAPSHLKLFYSLDDVDACILARPSNVEGSDERCEDNRGTRRRLAAA